MFEDLDQHDRIRDAFANALARLQKPRREAVRLGNLQGLGIDVGNDGIVARLGQFQGIGPATAADIEDRRGILNCRIENIACLCYGFVIKESLLRIGESIYMYACSGLDQVEKYL